MRRLDGCVPLPSAGHIPISDRLVALHRRYVDIRFLRHFSPDAITVRSSVELFDTAVQNVLYCSQPRAAASLL
jgi:hypothetical protein